MVLKIEIKGIKEIQKFFSRLPKELNKEILNSSENFMKGVLKSAINRAGDDSGFLRSQLKIRKEGNSIILDAGDAYYAFYQEFGFRPHVIPVEYFDQHYSDPATPGKYISNPRGFVTVSKSKPFLIPALQFNLSKLPSQLKLGVDKAIKNSK